MKIFGSIFRGIARVPLFLLGLFLILFLGVVLVGGFYAWGWYAACGKSVAACIVDAINPLPESYGRGVGIPMICGPDEEQDGALCYPRCEAGYTGVGPVCWQNCPANYRDDGAFCAKPEPYGRGAGYALWDKGKCESEHGSCEQDGLLFYPVCAEGFHAVGCCICSPSCPVGMVDMGVSCTKQSYGRTAGVPLHACPEGHERDAALCYPVCKPGFKGVGPVCWEEEQ
jgi:hypothetical protein